MWRWQTSPVKFEIGPFREKKFGIRKKSLHYFESFREGWKVVFCKTFSHLVSPFKSMERALLAHKIKRKRYFLLRFPHFFVPLQIENDNTGRLSEHLNIHSASSLACWQSSIWACFCWLPSLRSRGGVQESRPSIWRTKSRAKSASETCEWTCLGTSYWTM